MRAVLRKTLAPLAALAACGTTEPTPESSPSPLRQGATSLAMVGVEHGVRIRVRTRRADGTELEIAELTGVWLDVGDGGRWLLPGAWQAAGDALTSRCAGPPDHDVWLTVRLRADGELDVRVEDRIGVRVPLAGLGVGWRLLTTAAIDEASLPLQHPAGDVVAGDAAFRAPIGFIRAAERALALVPDLAELGRARRLPNALMLERSVDGPLLVHAATIRRTVAGPNGPPTVRESTPPIQVRNDIVRIAHRLSTTADAVPGQTLRRLQGRMWLERVSPELQRSAAPFVTETWRSTALEALDRRIGRDLRSARRAGVEVAYLVDPELRDATHELARFGASRNQLDVAIALARRAARDEDAAATARATALQLARFVLLAPRRGGLVPHAYRWDRVDGVETWPPGDPGGSRPGALNGADAAATGVRLLELAELLPELAPMVEPATAELARFLSSSQRRDGAIPALYEPKFLSTIELDEDELPGTTAGPALFLARFAAVHADPAMRAAAVDAVRYIARRIRADDAPVADPSRARSPLRDPRSGVSVRDLVPLTAAAAAALALAEDDPSMATVAEELLGLVAGLQQIWTPPWFRARLLGGFGASNADVVWNAPGQALAAQTMFDGYAVLGAREWLERGTAALRAALLEPAPFVDDVAPRPDALPFAASAAAVVERCLQRFGQAVVNVDRGFALGLDAAWLQGAIVEAEQASFQLRTHAASLGSIQISIRSSGVEPTRIIESGAVVARLDRRRLSMAPRVDPVVEFRPPSRVPVGPPWRPVARYSGPPPTGAVTVEIRRRGDLLDTVALGLEDGGRLELVGRPFYTTGLVEGDRLQVRLVMQDGARRRTVPIDGSHYEIAMGAMSCLDPGDDLEDALVESTAGTRVVRFADGRENARQAMPGASFAYALSVPREAAAVEARILATGALEVTDRATGRVLYADRADVPPGDRSIEFRLADPRLWPDGTLVLQIRSANDAACSVARIEFSTSGVAARTEASGRTRQVAAPDVRIELVVLPVAARAMTSQLLAQAFSGGSDYRRTPAPESRVTSGSAARWISELSGGRSELVVDVRPPWQIDLAADDLSDPNHWVRLRDALERDRDQLLGRLPESLDAIVVVMGGPPADAPRDLTIADLPWIVLPSREPDGSLLSSGRIAREILTRLRGLESLDTPRTGNFGELALTADGAGHLPVVPVGINLVRTGWADVLDVDRDRSAIRLPPLVDGRTLLRLPAFGLPGAPDLLIECRRDPPGVGGVAGGGLLVYREFAPGEEPLIRTLDGAEVRPRIWRLSAMVPSLRTPLVRGTWSDLIRDTFRLDDRSPPSLTTPRGETPWTIRRIDIMERATAELDVHSAAVDLLQDVPRGWRSGIGDATGPIAENSPNPGMATVRSIGRGPEFTFVDRDGSTLQAAFEDPGSRLPRRLYGRIEKLRGGDLQLRIVHAGSELANTALPPGDTEFVATVPAGEGPDTLVLELVRRSGLPTGRLGLLRTVPLSAAAVAVQLASLETGTARLADGVVYGGTRVMRLDEQGRANARIPILPPTSRAVLRIVAGTPERDLRSVSLRVALRDDTGRPPLVLHEGLVVGGPASGKTPLTVALLELPETKTPDARCFLDLQLSGPAGATLHLVAVDVDRL